MTSLNQISTKTIARIAAVQVIYQYNLTDQNQDVNLLMEQIIRFYQDERAASDSTKSIKVRFSISHFELLVKSVIEHLPEIDEIIEKHLSSEWKITNLPILLLALLRVAICELQYFSNVPSKVVINEFTDITSDMLSEKEVAFVNSILDNIAKK
ncbi:MAG: transcription antitermination factor NusB [Rickettsia endosymbiont of Bryobia graminum]|nr:transcription antitermination factor NusB [Rickettsia endosymbiont of Bryobia graminum]